MSSREKEGFVLGILALAIGMPIYWIFVAFVVSALLSEIADNASQIYYYRRGIIMNKPIITLF